MEKIRNFVIIAHIDSGKSTLADRLLEITGTVDARRMKPQYLDKLELERERGITIKMAPVRMNYRLTADDLRQTTKSQNSSVVSRGSSDSEYILNLIDTPGHSDFSYEVSRALQAVEGAILLIDGTRGIQAQTLSNLRAARKANLKIIGAVNKIDLDLPHIDKVIKSTADLLGVSEEEIFMVSAKTGEGVAALLEGVIGRVPPPRNRAELTQSSTEEKFPHDSALSPRYSATANQRLSRALIFDSLYDDHKGILAFVRVFGGGFRAGEEISLLSSGANLKIKEAGYFTPELKAASELRDGEIGYIATGLKEPALVNIGDTIIATSDPEQLRNGVGKRQATSAPLPGYKEPAPVVFISFYPDGDTKFEDLKRGLERLRLTDAALSFEPDANDALGRGLKVGFLGQLHFEITASRLEREFNLEFLTSFPSIAYRVRDGEKDFIVKDPHEFPMKPEKVWQPMIKTEILAPQAYLNQVVNLKTIFDVEIQEIKNIGENLLITARMPLAELIRDFDDKLKSVSAGFASFSYELDGEAEAEMEKLEILVVEEVVPALTRIVAKKDLEREARNSVERLKELLPKQQFSQAVQARAMGRIIARETIPAMKKLLGNFGKTGGDRTRKMKLWKKQQRGKKKLKEMGIGKVSLSPEIFREILKK